MFTLQYELPFAANYSLIIAEKDVYDKYYVELPSQWRNGMSKLGLILGYPLAVAIVVVSYMYCAVELAAGESFDALVRLSVTMLAQRLIVQLRGTDD